MKKTIISLISIVSVGLLLTSWENNKINSEMVLVNSGTFHMGSKKQNKNTKKMEPHQIVKLTYNFYIGNHEVTQKEYKNLMGNNPSHFKGDSLPVEQVTWFDSIKYCNALSKKESLPLAYNEKTGQLLDSKGNVTTDIRKVVGYRLPTEAEWEYSARGGNKSKDYFYSGSNNLNEVAWFDKENVFNIGHKTHEVARKKANELGLYDMSGNVSEWCTDAYDSYKISTITNPYIYKNTKNYYVTRGGDWFDSGLLTYVYSRNALSTSNKSISLGFRVVKNK